MNQEQFNQFCASLPHTTHVVQWGGSDVWKIGGKVFAIAGWDGPNTKGITFKVTELSFDILKEQPGLRPAPYLASRGMKWIQHYDLPGLSDDDLQDYIQQSYKLISLGLTKKLQKELGLNQE